MPVAAGRGAATLQYTENTAHLHLHVVCLSFLCVPLTPRPGKLDGGGGLAAVALQADADHGPQEEDGLAGEVEGGGRAGRQAVVHGDSGEQLQQHRDLAQPAQRPAGHIADSSEEGTDLLAGPLAGTAGS